MIKEIPLNSAFVVRPKSKSSSLEVRRNFTFKIDIPTLDAPISTNKAFIFKLTIEDYFKNYFGLIGSKFLRFLLGHPVEFYVEFEQI